MEIEILSDAPFNQNTFEKGEERRMIPLLTKEERKIDILPSVLLVKPCFAFFPFHPFQTDMSKCTTVRVYDVYSNSLLLLATLLDQIHSSLIYKTAQISRQVKLNY